MIRFSLNLTRHHLTASLLFSRITLTLGTTVRTTTVTVHRIMSTVAVEPFPSVALLPKKESTALSYLTKYPEYDGRGVVIAIFDTGVDPGAPGFQVTTDGKPKIIDIISGSGDHHVDTSTVVTFDQESNTIKGLTGRKLKIPNSWNNPSGRWHIGVKNIYEMYPSEARQRIQTEYQVKNWDPFLRDTKARCLRELQKFEAKEEKENKENKENKSKGETNIKTATDSSEISQNTGDSVEKTSRLADKPVELILEKEELQAKVDVINSLEQNYVDLGPIYDCIVWHDGEMWRACLDSSQTGDLENCTILGPYKDTLKYATLTVRDQLNYTVNIFDEGNLLELNCVSGDHGTHVGAIAAANFPEEPEKNGVAPGAQIISVNIANARFGDSMETGTSIIRACLRAIEAGADIINMSFGEPIKWGSGRVLDMMNDVVRKHGIIFCTAAGNSGPSLSTANSSCIPTSVIGVGAYVSPEMMEVEYSTREKISGRALTFSSKDPNIEGGQSVSICAPGAAIASISRATLVSCALFNGTSMASPNAAGGIALLLSGLKQKKLPYSPFSVRRALENTALKPPTFDPFVMGNGLIQVEPAFEHCTKFSSEIERDVRFSISCSEKQGIYLREASDVIRPSVHLISIEPFFLNHDDYDNRVKADFEMKLSLTCDAPWIQAPNYLLVTNCRRVINLKIDPTGLSPGAHVTYLKAFDSMKPEKGFIFQVPITVIKPITFDKTVGSITCPRLDLTPGVSHFTHIIPPPGSSVAIMRVKNIGSQATGTCLVNVRQLLPQSYGSNLKKDVNLQPQAESVFAFAIHDNRTMDLAITKWWSSLGDASVSYMLEFAGCKLNTNEIRMLASESVHKLDLIGSAPIDHVHPKISLNHCLAPLKPVEDKISPLSSRDILPEGRQVYQLVLTYNFNLAKAADATIICPLLDTLIYENEYESHIWMVFNSHKQFMLSGEAVTNRRVEFGRYMKKLDKGDYVVLLQIRHDNVNLLKKLTKLPVHLCTKLTSAVNLDIYPSYKELLVDGKKFSSQQISAQTLINAYISSLAADKVPKSLPNSQGTFLCGTLCLAKDEFRKKAEEFPFYYVLDGEPPKKSNKENAEDKSVEEQYKDAFVDFKANWISKFAGTSHEFLLTDLNELSLDQKHAIILAQIQALTSGKDAAKNLLKVIELADEILKAESVDQFYGKLMIAKNKNKLSNDDATAKKDETLKNLEKQKDRLCEALTSKGLAILSILYPEPVKEVKPGTEAEAPIDVTPMQSKYAIKDVDEIVQELKKLADLNNSKWHKFVYRHAVCKGHYGRALKSVLKQQENKPTKELDDQLIECLDAMGWKFGSEHFKRSLFVKHPPSYRLF